MQTSFVSKTSGKVWEVVNMKGGYGIRVRGVESHTLTIVPYKLKRDACEQLEYFRQLVGVEEVTR